MEARGGEPEKQGNLEVAATIVGLLAGIVAVVYMLGGTVIALRLLFDDSDVNSGVMVIGQLPREVVITTALLNVIGPAALIGLIAGLFYGAFNGPRKRKSANDSLTDGRYWWLLLAFFAVISVAFAGPTLYEAAFESEDFWPLFAASLLASLLTYGLIAVCWYRLRRLARTGWRRSVRAVAAGALWAVIALVPATMLASARQFEEAKVCTTASQVPEEGRFIGEGGGRIFLEHEFGESASIVSLPSDEMTKAEYGDVASIFACPPPPGGAVAAEVAAAALGGHGSATERRLARQLRPRLRFDTSERWRPVEVEGFLGERFVDRRGHEACGPAGCEPIKGIEQLRAGAGAPAYIDIHGEEESGPDYKSPLRRCRSNRPFAVDCNEGRRAVIYYRRTSHEGRWYWDYWWFLRYNDYARTLSKCNDRLCSDHEGDWEGVTVVTTPSLTPQIIGALYATHKNRVFVDGPLLPTSDGHPLVYVASGTHASYPFRCGADCEQYATLGGGPRLPEDSHDGAIAWGGNSDEDCLRYRCVRPLPESGRLDDLSLPLAAGWARWPGRWGESCHAGCDGFARELQPSPESPGTQTRFKCPWVATDQALPASDGSGLSRAKRVGDAERLLAFCAAQRGGL